MKDKMIESRKVKNGMLAAWLCAFAVPAAFGVVEVPVLTDEQAAFLKMTPAERRFHFTNEEYRAKLAVWEHQTKWRAALPGETSRLIHIPGIPNMRDLGGLSGLDGRKVRRGLVYRAGGFNNNATYKDLPKEQWKPGRDRLTAETRALQERMLGIRTDLDLRTDAECFGMTGSPLGPQVRWAHISSRDYGGLHSEEGRAAFAKCFRLFLDRANYPIGFHCIAGADRTGSLAYVLLELLGVSDEDVLLDWELTALQNPNHRFAHEHRYDVLVAKFAKYPGTTAHERVEAFVKGQGFTDADIETFRSIMLEDACGRPDSDFKIGAYCLASYAQTEQHVKDIRDCHVDFIEGIDYRNRKVLDLFAKYGIKAIVKEVFPSWWGGAKEKNGTLSKVVSPDVIEARVKAFRDVGTDRHPAVWMVSVGDEPSALDFPYYHDYIEQVRGLLPRPGVHINVHPAYPDVEADFGYMGAKDYDAYIRSYVENVPVDYISYDYYLYSRGRPGGMGPMFKNFRIVADACRETGRAFWFVPQVDTNTMKVEITEPKLRYQANVAMAYGAESLVWACWSEGWWLMNVLDTNGVKTVQYDRLKRVNAEVKSVGRRLLEFRSVATRLVGFEGHADWLKGSGETSVPEFSNGFVRGLKADDGDALVVGDFSARRQDDCRKALYVVAVEDAWDENPKVRTVSFACGREVAAYGPGGEVRLSRLPDGRWSFEVKSNEAVMLVIGKEKEVR